MSKYTTDRVPYPPHIPSQLKPQLLAFGALNPFSGYNSSPRQAMLAKQIGQTLVVKGAETRRILTGVERELGKYTFSKKFEHSSYILKVIPKFPYMYGKGSDLYSPVQTVIYEKDDADRTVDVMYLEDYFNLHHYFGWRYKFNENVLSKIKKGARVPEGTIVADSPNVNEYGDYAYGINANVLMCSRPGGAEDGIEISESFAKKLTTTLYETREISFGDGMMPLNTYGDDDEYLICPNIGDVVREDGILCALREYVPELAPCDLSRKGVRRVTEFDKCQYAPPGARVVDITVTRGSSQPSVIFTGQEDQVTMYHDRHLEYYKEVIGVYKQLKKEHGSVKISGEFHRLLVEAEAMLDNKVVLKKKRNRVPPWTVSITVEYELEAKNGFKQTDTHGGKSVTVAVVPDKQMPIDKLGNRVDIIVNDISIIGRLIEGKPHESFIGASIRDTAHRVREMVEDYGEDIPDRVYNEVFEYILGLYKIISPPFYDLFAEVKPDIRNHVDHIIEEGFYIQVDTDNPVGYMDVVKLLNEHYPPCNDTLTFINDKGETEETKDAMIVGQIYYMLLEKIANDFSAVSSSKLQHFGLPSKLSNVNKYDNPIKTTPVRFGESEYRLFVATAGDYATAELADRSTNIKAHDEILRNIIEAAEPTNVYSYIDRDKFPIGGGFIQRIIQHEFSCIGIKFK